MLTRIITAEEGMTLQNYEVTMPFTGNAITPSNTAYFFLEIDPPSPDSVPIKSTPSEIYEIFESNGHPAMIIHVWKMLVGTSPLSARQVPITNAVI